DRVGDFRRRIGFSPCSQGERATVQPSTIGRTDSIPPATQRNLATGTPTTGSARWPGPGAFDGDNVKRMPLARGTRPEGEECSASRLEEFHSKSPSPGTARRCCSCTAATILRKIAFSWRGWRVDGGYLRR